MKLFARVGIAAFLAVCVMMWAGCSWADDDGGDSSGSENAIVYRPHINLIHHTGVALGDDGKPQYDSTELQELYFDFSLNATGIPQNEGNFSQWPVSGEIAVVPKANLVVQYYDVNYNIARSEYTAEYTANKSVSFDLYPYSDESWSGDGEGWLYYYLASADVSGQQRAFFGDDGVENALSRVPYTFKFINSNISGEGTLPEIKTSADYYTIGETTGDGRVPRVPYIRPVPNDDGKIFKLEYGFVDPTEKGNFTWISAESAIRIRGLDIFLTDGNSLHSTINIDGDDWLHPDEGRDWPGPDWSEQGWYDGTPKELQLTKITPIELKKISSLRIGFDYPSSSIEEEGGEGEGEGEEGEGGEGEEEGTNNDGNIPVTSSIFYYWNFNNPNADWYNREPTIMLDVPEEELKAIDDASDDLGVILTEIVPISSDAAEICTNTMVDFGDSGIIRDRTMSAISVAQTVAEGGAVVLGSNLKLPVNSKTIGNYVTLDPPDPDDPEAWRSKYKVLKGFSGGHTIDLLYRFGEAFDYDGNSVTLTAAIVIIDNEAPSGDSRIVKPFDSALFGVRSGDLKDGLKVLYIYDGKKDREAKDPIALVANDVEIPDSRPSRPSNPPVDSQPTEPDDELPPDSDYNAPPEGKDTTKVSIDLNSENKGIIVRLAVTLDGRPIPAGIQFRIWLFPNQDTAKVAAPSYIGPFMVKSGEGVLEIDVNNLKNPDVSKASISKGSYVIKFSDDEGKYIGTTPSVELEATGTQTPPVDEGNEKTGSSSGGCDAGWGLFGLLLAGFTALKFRKA
jgi:hypothetical protein